ncbi:MAG: hypothetical protein LLG01_00380 [Planctomycetaceae bacterium]|nr:hypothetical protein [Planctomycetaceae bacterium]
MTHRERIIKTLLCEKTDRPPFPCWLGFWPWGQTNDRWKKESGIADLDIFKYFGFEPFFHGVPVEYGPFPHFEYKVISETDEFITAIDWRGVTTRNRRDGMSMPDWVAHPVRNWDDWNKYKAEHLQPQIDVRTASVAAWAKDAAKLDLPIQIGNPGWGVFGTARDMMGAEELLIAFYDMPDLVHDIMKTYVDLWLAMYEAAARHIQIDHIHIWEDMSGKQGSLISMKMTQEFMMPHYDRIAAFAKRRGVAIISVDSDGDVHELVPLMMQHGLNAFFPFEVQAGNDICEYRKLYPKLGILGGLDKNALSKGKKEVHVELDRAACMLAAGGYIVGFDHLIPPDAKWENFKYMVEHLRTMCGL